MNINTALNKVSHQFKNNVEGMAHFIEWKFFEEETNGLSKYIKN